MSFRIKPSKNDVFFAIYWGYQERPEVGDHNLVTVLPDFSSCSVLDGSRETCEYDPYTVFISGSSIPRSGEYYLGIRSYWASNGTRSRVRRSCFDGARIKRSCITYKDPPPRPTTDPRGEYKLQVPIYDADKDVNYTVNSFTSPCKFWDVKNETWSSKGCKVSTIVLHVVMID